MRDRERLYDRRFERDRDRLLRERERDLDFERERFRDRDLDLDLDLDRGLAVFATAAATTGTTCVPLSGDFGFGRSGEGVFGLGAGVFCFTGVGVFGLGVSGFFSFAFSGSGGFSSDIFFCVSFTSLIGLFCLGSWCIGVGNGVSSTPTPRFGSNSRVSFGGFTSFIPSSLNMEFRDLSRLDISLALFDAGETCCSSASTGVRESLRAIGGSTGVSLRGVVRLGLFCLVSGLGVSDLIGGSGGVDDFLFDGPGSSLSVLLVSCRFG